MFLILNSITAVLWNVTRYSRWLPRLKSFAGR